MVRRTRTPSPTKSASASSSGSGSENLRSKRPWESFAPKYFEAGWVPLPLPPRRKSSPPTGSTGKYDMPDKNKVMKWHRDYQANGNIALRMPDTVIGIDVDAYGEKVGRASFEELCEDLGPLPPTWTLTARSDGISGIRFFQVPAGLHWSGQPIADIQIIQNHHRYAVAYPSIHPDTKKIYLWYPPGAGLNGSPEGITVDNEIPLLTDLAPMPAAWVEGLSGGRMWSALPSDVSATRADILEWVKERPSGEMCRLMRKQVAAAVDEISAGGAHDALNSRVYSVVSLASEGHSGVVKAIRVIRDAFYKEVKAPGRKGQRTDRQAIAEFNRVRDGAVRIMMASVADGESVVEEECGCTENSLSWGEKLGVVVEEADFGGSGGSGPKRRAKIGKAKAADKYTYDDSGNAEHLLDILDGSAYYVAGEKAWYFWTPASGAWAPDPHGNRVMQASQLVGKRQRELCDEWTDKLVSSGSTVADDVGGNVAGKIGLLSKHAKVSSDHKGLTNMAKIAAAQDRALQDAEAFDCSPSLLACPNGTLELGMSGVRFRPAARSDLVSLTTGTRYVAGATSEAWDAYLARFIPDASVARYVQKIAGYTLFGSNPERKMFFMQGTTSTGKTTFVNAFNGALGEYAGTMNLSLFRDNQDERPRADLVRGLGKRLLSASEASAEWYLHADQVKRLTGGDPIRARLLYSSTYIERVPAFTPWVATNAMPQMTGKDKAIERRLVCVPFREVVAEGAEDFRITVALASAEGRSAVLAWAVRGWELYREEGMVAPSAVVRATAKMLGEMSDLDVFLGEVTRVNPTGKVSASKIFNSWMMWADANNVDVSRMSSNKFGRELSGRGYGVQTTSRDGRSIKMRTGLSWIK